MNDLADMLKASNYDHIDYISSFLVLAIDGC